MNIIQNLEARLAELVQARNQTIEARDAKVAELNAYAADEQRSASEDDTALVALAIAEVEAHNADIDARDADIADVERQLGAVRREAGRREVPAFVRGSSAGDINDVYDIELRTAPRTAEVQRDVRDRALRAVEARDNGLSDEQRDHVEGLIRNGSINRHGAVERHILTTGRPAYRSAFAKLMRGDVTFTEAEGNALAEMRAINITTDGDGGFMMPFTLDPSIVLVNNGQTNPMRQLATVRTVATDNWQGVNTTGVTASWDGESEVVSDDSPTFTQPAITVKKPQAFVPYTYEAEDDFASLAAEITTVLGDSFDSLEAAGFATGSGSGNVVQGIVTGLLAGGSTVATAGVGTYALADLDALSDAVPDRYDANAVFLMHRTIVTATRNLAPADDPVRHLDSGGPMVIRSRNAFKYSALDAAPVATGKEIVVCGDIRAAYAIHDRLGITVERIQNLFHPATGRPTGERGWLARKRVGAGVVNANAARVLQVA